MRTDEPTHPIPALEQRMHATVESLEPRRLLAAGDPDMSFGVAGRINAPIPADADISDSVVLSDGKIVFGGSRGGGPDLKQYFLTRYNADGTLDTNFGDAGQATGVFFDQFESEIVALSAGQGGKIFAM